MSVINAIPLLLGDEGYNISRSVRLRSSASAYFNRTPGTAGNRRTYTYSAWIKRGLFQASFFMLGADDGSIYSNIGFISGDYFGFNHVPNTGGTVYQWRTQAVFRDPSAWYHVVCAIDTTQATAANRIRIYVNGTEQTSLVDATGYGAIPQNTDTFINSVQSHMMGRFIRGANNQFDGYLTEVNFIDGQQLTPAAFGETDAITGVWKPKKYAGTYGTNGFYLNFSDNSAATAAAIGKDNSGNANNWTPNNISVTAGATYDSMIDVPTLYADGGNGRGNYAVLNPLQSRSAPSRANLEFTQPNSGHGPTVGTMAMTSGKWYWEVEVTTFNSASSAIHIGIVGDNYPFASGNYIGNTATSYAYRHNAFKYNNASASAYGASYTAGDIIGVALDLDAGTLTFYKNNASQGTAYSSISGTFYPAVSIEQAGSTSTIQINFGQRPFAYTPPTGFKALNTQNLPAPTILKGNKYFDATTWTGNNVNNRSITGAAFQPDLVWTKARSVGYDALITDAVRGSGRSLTPSSTGAEVLNNVNGYVSAFNADGFTLTQGASSIVSVNESGQTYVGWQWKANGSAVTNTSGSITSQVSAGTSQGFSVVTYTGNATNGATVGHGLGVAPKMVIIKNRTAATVGAQAQHWIVYNSNLSGSLTASSTTFTLPATANVLQLNLTLAVNSYGMDAQVNGTGYNYVAYCFSEVAGFSKFGSYTGNGSADGPMIFTGFRPAFVMIKRTDSTGSWEMMDTSRDTYNLTGKQLFSNLSNAEFAGGVLDLISNGFKLRDGSTAHNASGGTYIYAAFAEVPAKYSLAR
jgi:hypothetical protein